MALYKKNKEYTGFAWDIEMVEAFQWTIDKVPDWWKTKKDITIEVATCTALIPTSGGIKQASPRDYIIKAIDDECYPCKPDLFEAAYTKYTPERERETK